MMDYLFGTICWQQCIHFYVREGVWLINSCKVQNTRAIMAMSLISKCRLILNKIETYIAAAIFGRFPPGMFYNKHLFVHVYFVLAYSFLGYVLISLEFTYFLCKPLQ